jgi:membrane fusion protein (multidrug efflux system)
MKAVLLRRISVIAAVAIIAGSIGINKFLAAQKEPPKKEPKSNTTPVVKTLTVQQDSIATAINTTGRLIATDKIDVYAEVTGRLRATGKPFKDGASFKKGNVLLSLDNSDSRMSLVATRANFQSALTLLQADLATDYPDNFEKWDKYMIDFNPEKSIKALPVIDNQQEKNFLVSRNIYNQYYSIRSQELQLSKYNIYAPFNGVVHNANITPGALVRAGQLVGQYISTQNFELEVGISVSDQSKVRMGDQVLLSSNDISGQWIGEVTRISQGLDQNTQTFKVYVSVSSEELSEGLYLEARLGGRSIPGSTKIPANLIIDNAFVFGIEGDTVLSKHNVNLMHESEGYAIVKGIPEGTVLLNQALPGATEGMLVKVKHD